MKIVFLQKYHDPDYIRGLEEFSHLWLIWDFSEVKGEKWSPTVRPPRLGGNKRVGVFATRSPFRPNPIGLSSVKIENIILNHLGSVQTKEYAISLGLDESLANELGEIAYDLNESVENGKYSESYLDYLREQAKKNANK